MVYDLIIIGAGPAGMTAGVFAKRKGLKALLISKDIGGQASWTKDIENYMGFQEIDGTVLMERFAAQTQDVQLEEKQVSVRDVHKEGILFKVITEANEELLTKTIIITSGKKPKMLDIPGEVEFRNKGVSYCSACDSPLFRGVPAAVVGGGDSALKAVFDLSSYASEIHLIYVAQLTAEAILVERLKAISQLKQYPGHQVTAIMGNQFVEKVGVTDLQSKNYFEIPVQGVFIEVGLDPITEFIKDPVHLNKTGEIEVDSDCQTNIPGMFAAGDVTSIPEKQIIIASGEGAKAAINAWEYLLQSGEGEIAPQ